MKSNEKNQFNVSKGKINSLSDTNLGSANLVKVEEADVTRTTQNNFLFVFQMWLCIADHWLVKIGWSSLVGCFWGWLARNHVDNYCGLFCSDIESTLFSQHVSRAVFRGSVGDGSMWNTLYVLTYYALCNTAKWPNVFVDLYMAVLYCQSSISSVMTQYETKQLPALLLCLSNLRPTHRK